ncbi:MAG: 5-oxoprolinase subunit PxpB [Desulfarculus sp.]|nr:5-oxoprolinase subunit PxpB [Desulfarculus sp.]
MSEHYPYFAAQGDSALLLHLGQGIDLELNRRLRAFSRELGADPLPGQVAVMAAYACLLVQFDPLLTDHLEVETLLRERLAGMRPSQGEVSRRVEVPVVYGGEHGPDLAEVARRAGISTEEVIARHSGRDHCCYLVGFTPGFPFLGGLDERLVTPRLDTPRADLPPGAVGIGGEQTGLYPLGGPGGWRILGRSPLMIYDPGRDPLTLIQAGDLVRFKPVAEAEFPALPASDLTWQEQGRPVLEVLRTSGLVTIQDQGRRGSLEAGVPVSGALDQASLALANALVGNPPEAAALELTLVGPRLRALDRVTIALAGADLSPRLDGRPAPLWTSLTLEPGQVLEFGGPKGGARAILAVAGGLANQPLLGSRSAYPLGRLGRPLAKGDILRALPGPAPRPASLPPELRPQPEASLTLRAVPGPNHDFFTAAGQETLFNAVFSVSQRADRRGVRLEGPPVELDPRRPSSIISEPNTPGIVQVPPDGAPMILLREQTVGGYAKAATVIGPDLNRLAWALPGQNVRFAPVSPAEAVAIARDEARRQRRLRQSLAG